MNKIIWSEQKKYGLNWKTKYGIYKDFGFDIRYDYDGDSNVKPEKCQIFLRISFKGVYFKPEYIGSVEYLTVVAERELEEILKQYREPYKFFCTNESTEGRCDKQCSWCSNKESK